MPDLLWLGLFTLACGCGWYLGQREWRVRRLQGGAQAIVDNRLLELQSDGELERLGSLLPLTAETFDTHLAIARRFRQRGDLQQATSIHQTLQDADALAPGQRELARLELARDFLAAGELSRAEWLLLELAGRPGTTQLPALQALQRIYERERDWEKAIATGLRLEAGQPVARTAVAHYYCEWAEQFWQQADVPRALQLAGEALQIDAQCVRASLLLAEWQAGESDSAIRHLLAVATQDGDFLAEALPPLLQLARASASLDRLEEYLRSQLGQLRGTQRDAALLTLVEVLGERQGISAARSLLEQELARQPSLALAARLLELSEAQDCSPALRQPLQGALQRLQAAQPLYRCRQCGFQARRLHWQCPACHGWSVVRRRPE